jgi:hypothetical protein
MLVPTKFKAYTDAYNTPLENLGRRLAHPLRDAYQVFEDIAAVENSAIAVSYGAIVEREDLLINGKAESASRRDYSSARHTYDALNAVFDSLSAAFRSDNYAGVEDQSKWRRVEGFAVAHDSSFYVSGEFPIKSCRRAMFPRKTKRFR